MNDKPATEPASFDPARAGWQIVSSNTPFGDLVGPIWRIGEGERSCFGFVVAPKHLNRAGNLHGGMLMTLADNAMAIAAREATGSKRHATIELNIQFIGAVRLGDFIEAHPQVARATRSLVFMQARMFVGARLVVTTSGIWKMLDEA